MKTQTDEAASRPSTPVAPVEITIIYEDRATGLRAKRFSDLLNASLGCAQPKRDLLRLESLSLNTKPGALREALRRKLRLFELMIAESLGSSDGVFIALDLRLRIDRVRTDRHIGSGRPAC